MSGDPAQKIREALTDALTVFVETQWSRAYRDTVLAALDELVEERGVLRAMVSNDWHTDPETGESFRRKQSTEQVWRQRAHDARGRAEDAEQSLAEAREILLFALDVGTDGNWRKWAAGFLGRPA